MKNPRTILITGASSGIGKALALHYASGHHLRKHISDSGTTDITLALTGRDAKRLEETARLCREKGAKIHQAVLDVTNKNLMHKWLIQIYSRTPFDLVIANAGISGGTAGHDHLEPYTQVKNIFDVNFYGTLNSFYPLLPLMIERGRGQVALISSLAAYRGFAGAPAYSASKSAVKTFGEGLRGALHGTGVQINVVCPGFIVTPMTDKNSYKMPFLMKTEKAARIIASSLDKDKPRISFPWQMAAAAWLYGALPERLVQSLSHRLPKKGSL